MYFQFADDCAYKMRVTASPNQSKSLTFFPEKIAKHTILEINSQDGRVDLSCKEGANPAYTVLNEPELIYFMALLRPAFIKKKGNNEFTYAFGVDDGPPRKGVPTTAAKVKLTFSSDGQDDSYQEYNGGFVEIDERWIDGGWVLLLEKDNPAPPGSTNCQIELTPGQSDLDIEASVVLHVLDQDGTLLCIADQTENPVIMLKYARDSSFILLCLIRYQPKSGNGVELTFSIGDPRTDAKVTVIEEDGDETVFTLFDNLIRKSVKWFQSLLSS